MKGKLICTLIGMCLLAIICTTPSFGGIKNSSYRVPVQVLDGGGSKSFSDSFSLVGSIGQSTAVGSSESLSFHQKAGFIPQIIVRGDIDEEVCDGRDNDCDGLVDEDLGTTTCGVGACATTVENCVNGQLQVCEPLPPTEVEVCDGRDNDCDGEIDEGFSGLGSSCTTGIGECTRDGTVVCARDGSGTVCNAIAGESAPEICDGRDNDCDGIVDPPDSQGCTIYYKDTDNDTYGVTKDTKCLCSPASPYTATRGGDCNDDNAQVNLGAIEKCNAIDDNCDGLIDPPVSQGCTTYYKDADNDTYGVPADTNNTKCLCSPVAPYAATRGGDCNDGNPQINPGATEVCNGIDDNCNGKIDDSFDADGDGYGTCIGTGEGDCDDTDPAIHPGAAEVCDGKDNNCDGTADEGFNLQTDPTNCGLCGKVCAYPHAAALCASGQCQMGSCDEGWQDKDGNSANGCECEGCCSTWEAMIKATGQKLRSTAKVANVTIGLSSNPHTAPSPGMPPECTVYMRIKDKTLNLYYSVDIRSCSSESEYWILRVQIGDAADSGQPGYYPLLSWNPDQFSSDPAEYYSLYLGNQGNGTLLVANMRETTSYQIKQGDDEYFSIVWSKKHKEQCVDLNLSQEWNLVSLPVLPGNPTAGALFPDAEIIYEFEPSSGYLFTGPGSTMKVGQGYWVKVPAAKSYPVCGQKVSSYSQQLPQGWSLIGGISCTCSVQALSGTIVALYSFDPSYGYVLNPTHHLVPGLGYWINLSQPATIRMECPDLTSSGQTGSSRQTGSSGNLTSSAQPASSGHSTFSGQTPSSGHSALTPMTLNTLSLCQQESLQPRLMLMDCILSGLYARGMRWPG